MISEKILVLGGTYVLLLGSLTAVIGFQDSMSTPEHPQDLSPWWTRYEVHIDDIIKICCSEQNKAADEELGPLSLLPFQESTLHFRMLSECFY
jgi:hypothetical protein